jgi:hypothetical protein
VAKSRLNLVGALSDHAAEPSVQSALKRFVTHLGAAIERLQQLDRSSSSTGEASGADQPRPIRARFN